MKKILLLTFEYPAGKRYCGGVGQVVKQCGDTLLALGYKVYVLISPGFQKKYPVDLLDPNGAMIHYGNLFGFEKENSWLGFDYIIQHFVNWTQQLRKVKNHKHPRPRIVYHFHSILRRERESGFRTLNRFPLNQEKMIDIADKVICPSRYEYDNFCRYFPNFSEKLTMIENTIEAFPSSSKIIRDIKIKHRIKENDIVAIYVGRLNERILGLILFVGTMGARIFQKLRIPLNYFALGLIGFMEKRALDKFVSSRLIEIEEKVASMS